LGEEHCDVLSNSLSTGLQLATAFAPAQTLSAMRKMCDLSIAVVCHLSLDADLTFTGTKTDPDSRRLAPGIQVGKSPSQI
jgi:hypothetical protein